MKDDGETQGINNRVDLAKAEAVFRRRILEHWMREGVTILDPSTTYVDAGVVLKPDTRIWPGTIIREPAGSGPSAKLDRTRLLKNRSSKMARAWGHSPGCGPARVIEKNVHIGNFVEIKKSRMRQGSKANHLTYIGDADIGERTNVGAGTITCNYDGVAKYVTRVDSDVFIGSNANLVAPVHIGQGAMIAAGSTITENVPADGLAVARSRQMMKTHWVKNWFQKRKRGKS